MPHPSQTCLLIIDMIGEFAFDQSEHLFPAIEHAAERIATLKRCMKKADIPVIYVNDNFGKWRSDFRGLITRCLQDGCRGRQIAGMLAPDEDDYFVLKPKHSAFFATPLELLLNFLDARHLVLTGIAGNNCVLYTAADAYMREFQVTVPSDCTVSLDPEANRTALAHMQETLKADIACSNKVIARISGDTPTLLR
ncbi:MAG: cysteine hydrolase [Nitrospiraceae bacterium]|nr:cysteine hydrolase [Nitrospiraceae bacterium]